VTTMDTRDVAHALGGEIVGSQIVCPGPNHTAKDRSLSVRLSASAPDGFIVHSHAGDDWRACRDYVRERLGLPTANSRWLDPPRRAAKDRAAIADAAAKAPGTRQALEHFLVRLNRRGIPESGWF
jgi:putative DNA primase/helicase